MPSADVEADPRPASIAAAGRGRLVAEIGLVKRGELFLEPPLVPAVV